MSASTWLIRKEGPQPYKPRRWRIGPWRLRRWFELGECYRLVSSHATFEEAVAAMVAYDRSLL